MLDVAADMWRYFSFSLFVGRSPLSWDTVSGTMQFLDYERRSPQSQNGLKLVQNGDLLEVACLGSQLDLNMRGTSRFVLGSETSFGIAYALFTVGKCIAILRSPRPRSRFEGGMHTGDQDSVASQAVWKSSEVLNSDTVDIGLGQAGRLVEQ